MLSTERLSCASWNEALFFPFFSLSLLCPPLKLNWKKQPLSSLTATVRRHNQADPLHPNQGDASCFVRPPMCITSLRNLRFNGTLGVVRWVFTNTCTVYRVQRLFSSAVDYGCNCIRTSARPFRVCKHMPSLHVHTSQNKTVALWSCASGTNHPFVKVNLDQPRHLNTLRKNVKISLHLFLILIFLAVLTFVRK